MKSKLLILPILFLATSCIDLAKIVPAYNAKDYCSCIFVIGQDEDYCDFAVTSDPAPNSIKVDYEKQLVKASFVIFSKTARYVSSEAGCLLD